MSNIWGLLEIVLIRWATDSHTIWSYGLLDDQIVSENCKKGKRYKTCMSLIYQRMLCQDLINYKIVKSIGEGTGNVTSFWCHRFLPSKEIAIQEQTSCKFRWWAFGAIVSYLQRKLPFRNKLLSGLGCLNPQEIASSKPSDIEMIAKKLCTSDDNSLKVTDEWKVLSMDQSIHYLSYKRVNHFCWEVFSKTTYNDTRKYHIVTDVLKMALSLYHGNADVERGLSVNNAIFTKERNQLHEAAINGLRAKDAVKLFFYEPKLMRLSKNCQFWLSEESWTSGGKRGKGKKRADEMRQKEREQLNKWLH